MLCTCTACRNHVCTYIYIMEYNICSSCNVLRIPVSNDYPVSWLVHHPISLVRCVALGRVVYNGLWDAAGQPRSDPCTWCQPGITKNRRHRPCFSIKISSIFIDIIHHMMKSWHGYTFHITARVCGKQTLTVVFQHKRLFPQNFDGHNHIVTSNLLHYVNNTKAVYNAPFYCGN